MIILLFISVVTICAAEGGPDLSVQAGHRKLVGLRNAIIAIDAEGIGKSDISLWTAMINETLGKAGVAIKQTFNKSLLADLAIVEGLKADITIYFIMNRGSDGKYSLKMNVDANVTTEWGTKINVSVVEKQAVGKNGYDAVQDMLKILLHEIGK